jgi:hypothetical protein
MFVAEDNGRPLSSLGSILETAALDDPFHALVLRCTHPRIRTLTRWCVWRHAVGILLYIALHLNKFAHTYFIYIPTVTYI